MPTDNSCICHFKVSSISRSDGRSVTAAIAYRDGEKITDNRTGLIHDYTHKGGVEHVENLLPAGITREWTNEELWNAAEEAEKRKNSCVGREYLVAIPHELDTEQRRELAVQFAAAIVEKYGVAANVALHAPSKDGDDRNYHAHIMTSTRVLTNDGFGAKTRVLDDKATRTAEIKGLRELWATLSNAALERAGSERRMDPRSFAEQGIDRVPEVHLGPVATAMERRGENSYRGNINRMIRDANRRAEEASLAWKELENIDPATKRERLRQKTIIETKAKLDAINAAIKPLQDAAAAARAEAEKNQWKAYELDKEIQEEEAKYSASRDTGIKELAEPLIEAAKSTNLIYRLPLEKQYESIQTAIKNNIENPPRIKKWFGLVNTDTIDYDKQSEIEEALKEQSYDLYVQISKAKKKLEADIKTIMEDSGRKYDAAHVSERLAIRDKKAISQQLHTAADNARLEANKFEHEITAIKNAHNFDAIATEWKLLQDPNWLPPDEREREAYLSQITEKIDMLACAETYDLNTITAAKNLKEIDIKAQQERDEEVLAIIALHKKRIFTILDRYERESKSAKEAAERRKQEDEKRKEDEVRQRKHKRDRGGWGR